MSTFTKGQKVQIVGLENKSKYNGCKGRVVSWFADRSRYAVQIQLKHNSSQDSSNRIKIILLKPSKVVAIDSTTHKKKHVRHRNNTSIINIKNLNTLIENKKMSKNAFSANDWLNKIPKNNKYAKLNAMIKLMSKQDKKIKISEYINRVQEKLPMIISNDFNTADGLKHSKHMKHNGINSMTNGICFHGTKQHVSCIVDYWIRNAYATMLTGIVGQMQFNSDNIVSIINKYVCCNVKEMNAIYVKTRNKCQSLMIYECQTMNDIIKEMRRLFIYEEIHDNSNIWSIVYDNKRYCNNFKESKQTYFIKHVYNVESKWFFVEKQTKDCYHKLNHDISFNSDKEEKNKEYD